MRDSKDSKTGKDSTAPDPKKDQGKDGGRMPNPMDEGFVFYED